MSRLLRNVVDGLGMAAFIVGPRSPAAHPLEPAGPRPDEIEHGVPEGLWNACARLRDEVLVPAMTAGRLGRLAYMDTARAIPYYKYRPRHEILDLIDQGDAALRGSLRRTEYYRDQADRLGALRALLKVYRYRRLLRSVRETGLVFDPATREGLPLFFCARDINFRLDGTHRASVARYLGYRRVPVLCATPRDALGLTGLDENTRAFLEKLEEPEPHAFDPVDATLSRREIRRILRATPGWYQDVDFGRFLMTRRHPGVLGRSRHLLTLLTKNHKNRAVMAALPDLTGRRVLDIGCNAGLYSCYASMRGADAVLGIDMDVGRIEQARLVRDIFRGQGRVTGRVDFERIDITERPALVEEFDAILACCVLYHLGPVDELKRHIRQSAAELLIVQCNVVRGDRIGAKNRPGVAGHESGAKTWGNILGTVAGARAFMADCGFAVERITAARRQHPVLRGRRVRD